MNILNKLIEMTKSHKSEKDLNEEDLKVLMVEDNKGNSVPFAFRFIINMLNNVIGNDIAIDIGYEDGYISASLSDGTVLKLTSNKCMQIPILIYDYYKENYIEKYSIDEWVKFDDIIYKYKHIIENNKIKSYLYIH